MQFVSRGCRRMTAVAISRPCPICRGACPTVKYRRKLLKNVQEAIASWVEAAKEWKQGIPKPSTPWARTGGALPRLGSARTISMQRMQGGCHCGRVRFRVTADLDRVTECNCSMCAKKGFLHLIVA